MMINSNNNISNNKCHILYGTLVLSRYSQIKGQFKMEGFHLLVEGLYRGDQASLV